MKNSVVPTGEKGRIPSLDAMRGLAILGIYFVNMMAFHSPYLYINPLEWWDSGLDRFVYTIIDVFVQASFYPLFSMMFGYGLALTRERVLARGGRFPVLAARRLLFLLAVGFLHAFFVWTGDILITYSIIGLLTLFFLRLREKVLLMVGAAMYVIPNLMLGLLLVLVDIINPGAATPNEPEQAEKALIIYGEGSFWEVTGMRSEEWLSNNNLETAPILLFSLLPLFLIGAAFAKLKWLEDVSSHFRRLKQVTTAVFLLGTLIKVLPYILPGSYSAEFFQDFFGGPLLALAYAGIVAIYYEVRGPGKGYVTSVGRMSMTNYLLQSLVSTFIFYGYGLGLYGQISLAQGTLMVIGGYMLQILLSKLWLRNYRFGPVEWVWRSFTYLSWQKNRKREQYEGAGKHWKE
ncbi:hypothetical protein A8F94_16510 [Bacillus sp. FJAT-27225]|uniref:DUF418 domain-containing protein n=1 Tax=Bacillus sp. FJAT-27225 TaxID=1743144 RepID=UPI00080C2B99|nr:DUF418 domain-containing protein [Bacillus sp. FJAT-27225]OCA84312.1 hypothetical protein A8F94_16510 [Bacillus sp. FJAT-27225]